MITKENYPSKWSQAGHQSNWGFVWSSNLIGNSFQGKQSSPVWLLDKFISVVMWPDRSHLLMPAPLCLLILWCHHGHPAAYGCMCLSAGCRLRWRSLFNVLLITPTPLPTCLHLQLPVMIRLDSPRRPGGCQQDFVPFPAVLKNERPAWNAEPAAEGNVHVQAERVSKKKKTYWPNNIQNN